MISWVLHLMEGGTKITMNRKCRLSCNTQPCTGTVLLQLFLNEQNINSYRNPRRPKQKEVMGKIVISMKMDKTKNMQCFINIIFLYGMSRLVSKCYIFTDQWFIMTRKLQNNHSIPIPVRPLISSSPNQS